ncbi:hypothetical protein F4819DRAFT_487183 [Hypoxylon fuscum]|nr:hypothetical protein F4819DRAFT_487183 [Hypoxylon fuscum]
MLSSVVDVLQPTGAASAEGNSLSLRPESDRSSDASSSSTTPAPPTSPLGPIPYTSVQDIYKTLLDANVAALNLSAPNPELLYYTPSWVYSPGFYLDVPNKPMHYMISTYDRYVRELGLQYHLDKDWFRVMVFSFWGSQVKSIHQIMSYNRPFIQVALKIGEEGFTDQAQYIKNVEIFAYIIGRLRPIGGGIGPITDVFGFQFVDLVGETISDIELAKRTLRYPSSTSTKYLVIRHHSPYCRRKIINVKNQEWGTLPSDFEMVAARFAQQQHDTDQ